MRTGYLGSKSWQPCCNSMLSRGRHAWLPALLCDGATGTCSADTLPRQTTLTSLPLYATPFGSPVRLACRSFAWIGASLDISFHPAQTASEISDHPAADIWQLQEWISWLCHTDQIICTTRQCIKPVASYCFMQEASTSCCTCCIMTAKVTWSQSAAPAQETCQGQPFAPNGVNEACLQRVSPPGSQMLG